jgi:hypothetical protein
MKKLSLIISILDSHRIVARYMRHLKRMCLPDSVEILFIDDGSKPPLPDYMGYMPNFNMYYTDNFNKWTQGLARNWGSRLSLGDYLFMTDIDHIVSREAIEAVLSFGGDKMTFPRQYGVLDHAGRVRQDLPTLKKWGLHPLRYKKYGLTAVKHGNTWAMKREIFFDLGGYNLARASSQIHTMHEDSDLNWRYLQGVKRNKYLRECIGPPIFFYPMGRYHATGDENPFGFFHTMPRY